MFPSFGIGNWGFSLDANSSSVYDDSQTTGYFNGQFSLLPKSNFGKPGTSSPKDYDPLVETTWRIAPFSNDNNPYLVPTDSPLLPTFAYS